jgi:DDE family transposase
LQVNHSRARSRIHVTADGEGIVSHAGALLLAEQADRLGLTTGLSQAMAPTRRRRSAHDPGKVLVPLAVALADGADCLADLAVLRANAEVFGPVASDPTAWRVVASIGQAELDAINAARANARARAWAAGVRPGWIVLDLDSTLVTSHSEKEDAAPNYKHGFGFHPVMCYLDGTTEALAGLLRPGNAGSNTAADHLRVVDDALAQLPVGTRAADPEGGEWMLLRADSASATHAFVDGLRQRAIEFSIGFPLTADVALAVLSLPERAWTSSIDQTCALREGAECAEVPPARPGRLAGADEGDLPQGGSPPRRPAHLHRSRRPPVPGVHHRLRRPRHRVPRGSPPGPRPRRGPYPLRERHGAFQPALPCLRRQPGVAHARPRGG